MQVILHITKTPTLSNDDILAFTAKAQSEGKTGDQRLAELIRSEIGSGQSSPAPRRKRQRTLAAA